MKQLWLLWVVLAASIASAQTTFPTTFHWRSIGPIAAAPAEADYYALKDPSVVYYQGQYHIFCTVRGKQRTHAIVYFSTPDLRKAGSATQTILPNHPGYFCAPQVFYFAPQKRWYLICQAASDAWAPEKYRPAFATSENIADPSSWSALQPLLPAKPATVKAWLDFWVICDQANAHLFFTSLDGKMWRCQTSLAPFPAGWSEPVLALQDDIFEASHTYRIKGTGKYLTVIEAQGGNGWRYYKAYLADSLEGPWQRLAAQRGNPFADMRNVEQPNGRRTDLVSHIELLRTNYDQIPEVDPANLRFLYQGVLDAQRAGKGYGQIPWKLFLMESITESH